MINYSIKECTNGGRVGLRVGSGQTFCWQSRVGSGRVGSGRVGSKKSDPWTTLRSLDQSLIYSFVYLTTCSIVHYVLFVQSSFR